MNGAILANRSTASRRALDLYPTPPDVTHALMQFLSWTGMTIWEPAAGDGAMAKVLREYGNKVIESDIATGQDFLTTEPSEHLDAIVTNPPFNLSEQFIKRALSFTPNVAMVFKSQFWHAQKRLELFREHEPAYVLPLTWRPDFGGGGAPTMEVLWTVWLKDDLGSQSTEYIPLERPSGVNLMQL
jgi:hypothetical protein